MLNKEIFSLRLRALREKAGEDRKTLAQFLNVSISQISEMENGRKGTTMDRLVLLCEHYHISADYLLGLTDERRTLK